MGSWKVITKEELLSGRKLPLAPFSDNAKEVLRQRYQGKDANGTVIETIEDLFSRVAATVAKAERNYPDMPYDAESAFYNIMVTKLFMPNSPTLMNAGRSLGQLSACFVLPVEDSMDGIFTSVKNTALIHKTGGGTGFSFSRLRSSGAHVSTTGGLASGPVSFMKVFDAATETVKQAGMRRGANMGILRVDHPDIMEFITCKNDLNTLNNFNISVAITDAFMQALKEDGSYNLIDPKTKKTVRTLRARDVYETIVDSAWRTGEPGIVFIDTMNQNNFLQPLFGAIESTNPCVAGWTKILTDQGEVEIRNVCDQEVRVWNGQTFSTVTPHVTGENQETLIITFDNGKQLFVTPYHKFIMPNNDRIEAKDLKVGDSLRPWKLPNGTIDVATVTEITSGPVLDKVYCFTEPLLHAGTFNGIVTGNCGEQPLLPYEACNLGSINLAEMVNADGSFNFDLLETVTDIATRFLDDVIDVNKYPIPAISKMTKRTRKIGLGVMGFANALLKMRIPYNSEKARTLAEEIMQTINTVAWGTSVYLAEERGAYPAYNEMIEYDPEFAGKKQASRNATTTTIAPTGSISIIASTSSGIEPNFSFIFYRKILDGASLPEMNPLLLEALRSAGVYSEGLLKKIEENGGTLHGITEIPKEIRDVFVCAHDISPYDHIAMQAAFQRYTDNAVSKTINFPNSATKEDIDQAYQLAYELGCKGTTVYRDGSRSEQPMNLGVDKKKDAEDKPAIDPENIIPRTRENVLQGFTSKVDIGCGKLYVTVNHDEKGICEVFTSNGKNGGCPSQSEAVARLVSIALRSGVSIDEIVNQLCGIRCQSCMRNPNIEALSCPDAIGRQIRIAVESLKQEAGDIPGPTREFHRGTEAANSGHIHDPEEDTDPNNRCPECGSPLEHEGGCVICRACGWSKCG